MTLQDGGCQRTASGSGTGGVKEKICTRLCEKVPCQFLSAPSAGGRRLWVSERNVFKAARSLARSRRREIVNGLALILLFQKPSDTCHTGARRRSAHHELCGGCRQTRRPRRLRSASRKIQSRTTVGVVESNLSQYLSRRHGDAHTEAGDGTTDLSAEGLFIRKEHKFSNVLCSNDVKRAV